MMISKFLARIRLLPREAAKKNYVWTCNKDTKEQVSNTGSVAAIMRITDLKA